MGAIFKRQAAIGNQHSFSGAGYMYESRRKEMGAGAAVSIAGSRTNFRGVWEDTETYDTYDVFVGSSRLKLN